MTGIPNKGESGASRLAAPRREDLPQCALKRPSLIAVVISKLFKSTGCFQELLLFYNYKHVIEHEANARHHPCHCAAGGEVAEPARKEDG